MRRASANEARRVVYPGLIERFRGDVAAALGGEPGARLALAVSGGADSMAMLALAHAGFPGQTIAATVDHRLRPEAEAEAAMVARHCAALGIAHVTLAPATPIAGASVQARAREARYALLLDWTRQAGAAALLTAHHADDQAETFLMRAARGSGIAGLAAIRERRETRDGAPPGPPIARPLLGWRRAELRQIAIETGTPFFDDPSNADPSYDRTRFRQLLEENRWLDAGNIARTAAHLAEAERALIACTDMLWDERADTVGSLVSLDVRDLPRELRRRLVRQAIGHVRRRAGIDAPEWSDAGNIEPLLDALEAGPGATRAGVQATGGLRWRFSPAPPRRSH